MIVLYACTGNVNACYAVTRMHELSYMCFPSHVQLYRSLQPLMLCMSYNATLKLVDKLNEDFDAPVRNWRDSLVPTIQTEPREVNVTCQVRLYNS